MYIAARNTQGYYFDFQLGVTKDYSARSDLIFFP